MTLSLEQRLTEVWRQALLENGKTVALGKEIYPVRRTPKRGLRQVDFIFEGTKFAGLSRTRSVRFRRMDSFFAPLFGLDEQS